MATKDCPRGHLKFVRDDPVYARVKPYRIHKFSPPNDFPTSNLSFDEHQIDRLVDVRNEIDSPKLDSDSFQFVKHPSNVVHDESAESIKAYCEEALALLKSLTKTDRVICYEALVSIPGIPLT
jgi:hypothetical protein